MVKENTFPHTCNHFKKCLLASSSTDIIDLPATPHDAYPDNSQYLKYIFKNIYFKRKYLKVNFMWLKTEMTTQQGLWMGNLLIIFQ